MSLYDLIIRNGTLVTPDGLQNADIAISDGSIVAISPDIAGSSAQLIDATGLHIFPGLIDPHVHFNEPGRAHWEGITTGSRALAAGGGTTYFDMPLNAHPPTLDAASFQAKLDVLQQKSLVDFALWGGLVPGNLDCVDKLAAHGAIGFKAFMSASGIDDFPAADDLTLYQGMGRAARLGRIVAVHAENDTITGSLARQAIAEGHTSARDYLDSRPVVAELEAISRAILFARETGCALHIVHVSTGRGVSLVAEARLHGVDVSCETCPHYLVLTDDDLQRLGAVAKCAPPLRPQAEQDALWRHLHDGALPMVSSDHSPAPADMKGSADFFQIWGGISGCQSTLGLLLTAGYAERGLSLPTIARLTATSVVDRFGLAPRKGHLAVGADADLALVDLERRQVIASDQLFYRHQHSPYIGRTLHGVVVRTLLRGTTVYHDGQIVSPPIGKLITPHGQP